MTLLHVAARNVRKEIGDPRMRIQSGVMTGIIVAILLTTSSLAIYYRQQAVSFERDYKAAMAHISEMTAVSVTPEPTAPRDDIARSIPAVPQDADNRPTPPRAPEPQLAEKGKSAPVIGLPPPPRSAESERFRRRPSDWMENLRTNDPQRYAEFQQRREAMQQNMQNAWGQATNYFMNRDTSRMAQSDLDEYNTMVTLLSQAGALNQQLQSGLPPEERQQVMANLRSNIVAVVPLLENERNREYYDMARTMGQSEQDAATLVSYINQITSNTTLRTILPGVRMGGMGGPPGGMGPPGSSPRPSPSTR